jgi:hypothetical protein
MQRDEVRHSEPDREARRNEALAPYDAQAGIAFLVLAVMAFLIIVVAYQFYSAATNTELRRDSVQRQSLQTQEH